MRLELRELKDGQLDQQYCCGPNEFPALKQLQEEDQVRFDHQICFQLRLQKTGQIIEVDGQMQTKVGLDCGRCLQPFETDLQSTFSLTFTPLSAEREATEEEVELDIEELGLIYYKDEILDLLEPLQEQIIMALPISPLCDPACMGLCPECGCDLNKERCNCEKKVFNNKFAALSKLKIEKPKTES